MGYLRKKMEPNPLLYYDGSNDYYKNKKDRLKNVRSPTSKLLLTLLLSIAAHSLLLLLWFEPPQKYLSEHSIIHARLDKQDQELLQQEQVGQISEQHTKKISQASNPSSATDDQPLKQEATKSVNESQDENLISSQAKNKRKTLLESKEITPEVTTPEVEIEELVEKTEVVATQPKAQQESQTNNDSRAQVEALEGSEDPTYRSYHKVLTQYLNQRLAAKADYQGTVRLKIKLQYGSVATSVKIIQSSGNPEIDHWAKTAALAANPYPKIPKELGSTFEFSPTLQLGQTAP
jgi:TonB family protein